MQITSSIRRMRLLWFASIAMVAATPGAIHAQNAVRRSNERVLVLPPIPVGAVDTAFAIELGNEIRRRMESKFRFKMRIIPGETICEALEASGFECDKPLPAANAGPLARFLQARGYIVGWVERTGDSVQVTLRLVDAAGSGLSGWTVIVSRGDRSARDIARDVADALDDQVKAAGYARECDERRSRSDFRGARDRVRRAFEINPNHPSAALCLALLFEVQQQPNDSLIFALERAVRGDSLNGRAWEMLGRRYLDAGDTTKGVDAFASQLRAELNNIKLRHGVAVARMQQGRHEEAVEILQYALDRNPLDLPTLQYKARACVEGGLWECALDALSAEYEVDSSLVGDSIFYARAFGAAQSVDDIAGMLRWSGEATEHLPNSISLWRARAAALKAAGEHDGALAAYDRILMLDSNQVSSALAAVQLLLDSSLVVDTAVPLDTARLWKADTLLQLIAAQTSDTATSMNLAAFYYNPGSRIAQLRLMAHLPLAAHFLEQALAHDLRGSLTAPANFFLALAYFFWITELDLEIRESETCEMVDEEIDLIDRAKRAMQLGRSVSEQTATQILEYIGNYETAVRTYKPAFECP